MGTGLLAIVFLAILGYLTIGTYLFVALEAEDELKRQQELLQAYQNILDRFECLDRDSLKNMLEFIDQDLDMTRYLLRHNGTIQNVKWSPLGASQFAITVITTIGYGHITPRTANGRVACMVYAIFGIPLLLVFLTGIGEKLLKLSERCLTCRYGGCRSQFHQKVNFILQALVGLTILFILPTAGNMYIENWGVVESLYFNFVTLTTIGFGDLVAANPFNRDLLPNSGLISAFRWINFFWMFFGLAYISMLITAIMKYYLRSTGRVGYSASRRVKMLAQRVGQKLNCSTTRRNNRNFNTNHNDATINNVDDDNDTNNINKKKLKRTDEKQPSQSEIFSLSSLNSAGGDLHLDLHLTDTLASDLEVKLTKFSKLCQQVGLPTELCAELTPEELQRYQSLGERSRVSNKGLANCNKRGDFSSKVRFGNCKSHPGKKPTYCSAKLCCGSCTQTQCKGYSETGKPNSKVKPEKLKLDVENCTSKEHVGTEREEQDGEARVNDNATSKEHVETESGEQASVSCDNANNHVIDDNAKNNTSQQTEHLHEHDSAENGILNRIQKSYV